MGNDGKANAIPPTEKNQLKLFFQNTFRLGLLAYGSNEIFIHLLRC
jgi:hypothetical protein